MMGRTHALSGGAAWFGVAAAGLVHGPLPVAVGAIACSAGALLPDLDQVGSTASRSLGEVTHALAVVIHGCSGGHRQGTHSLIGAGMFALAGWGLEVWLPPLRTFPAPWLAALTLGVLVHIAGDMLTDHGCPLLWPAQRRCWLLPRVLRFTTGGTAEFLIRLLLAGVVALGIVGMIRSGGAR